MIIDRANRHIPGNSFTGETNLRKPYNLPRPKVCKPPRVKTQQKVECLECGNEYVKLWGHIPYKHDLTCKEYMEKHGLTETDMSSKEYRDRMLSVAIKASRAGDKNRSLYWNKKNRKNKSVWMSNIITKVWKKQGKTGVNVKAEAAVRKAEDGYNVYIKTQQPTMFMNKVINAVRKKTGDNEEVIDSYISNLSIFISKSTKESYKYFKKESDNKPN